jgi:hypothetical protein
MSIANFVINIDINNTTEFINQILLIVFESIYDKIKYHF